MCDMKQNNSMATSCNRFWEAWCEYIEPLPAYWVASRASDHLFYRNAYARDMLGVSAAFTTREDAFKWIHPDDIPAVEEAASHATKHGSADGECRIIVHGEEIHLGYRLIWRVCRRCVNQCAVLLGTAWRLALAFSTSAWSSLVSTG